jgi:hypothetical protein
MPEPICCPVCGVRELQTILRKAIAAAVESGEPRLIDGILAYRCANGHLFTTFSSEEPLEGTTEN